MALYETYADNCVKLGKCQEGVQTLQFLVRRNPGLLSGWLRLAALLLETGQVQHAVTTLQELTTLHPRYQEGQKALQQLLTKCKREGPTTYQPLECDEVEDTLPLSHLR